MLLGYMVWFLTPGASFGLWYLARRFVARRLGAPGRIQGLMLDDAAARELSGGAHVLHTIAGPLALYVAVVLVGAIGFSANGERSPDGRVSVLEDRPAYLAGLRDGDRVTHVGDREVSSIAEIVAATREHRPGDTVTIAIERDGATVRVDATLEGTVQQPELGVRAYRDPRPITPGEALAWSAAIPLHALGALSNSLTPPSRAEPDLGGSAVLIQTLPTAPRPGDAWISLAFVATRSLGGLLVLSVVLVRSPRRAKAGERTPAGAARRDSASVSTLRATGTGQTRSR